MINLIENQISYLISKEFFRLDFVVAVFNTLPLFAFGSNQEETMTINQRIRSELGIDLI